jgi:hypothetical protein
MIKYFSTKLVALVAISLIAGVIGIFAQSTVTGGIVGKVTDPQGAIVPNAAIIVTNVGTNKAVTTVHTALRTLSPEPIGSKLRFQVLLRQKRKTLLSKSGRRPPLTSRLLSAAP